MLVKLYFLEEIYRVYTSCLFPCCHVFIIYLGILCTGLNLLFGDFVEDVAFSLFVGKCMKCLEKFEVQNDYLMGNNKQSMSPLLDTLKMERVSTILNPAYPYPHEHSRHTIMAVVVGCLFFISSDNMHTLIQKLDSNVKWWSMYLCLIGFFYFFSSPFIGKTIKPSYSNFSRWYVVFSSWAKFAFHLSIDL